MQITEVFQVLGIELTKDERAIKNAYREKLAVTNPEDNPEGFKRLRTAYEEACRYATQSDEENVPERDESPSGLWVEKAVKIYKNIRTRQDVNEWKALFEEDIFFALEEEENCRFKLLRFLMENFKLPTDIWKLLDEKLHIREDAASLREVFPGDFIRYIVTRCERGEDVEFGQFEGDPEADYDLYLQYYDYCWNALGEKQYEQVEEYLKNADDLMIYHPVMEVCRAYLWVEQKKIDEAVAHLEKLKERYPADAMICYNLAEILWHNDQKEQAAQVYIELKETNEKHYMANVRLTRWYYEQGEYETAKKCAEKVLSGGADDEFMDLLVMINKELEKNLEAKYRAQKDVNSALELGWCYLQDGKINQGIRLAESVQEKEVPKERYSEYLGLLTKLYMEGTDYEQALGRAERWIKALEKRLASDESEEEKEKDRDRIRQYHLIKAQIFRAQGNMKGTKKPEECRKSLEKAIEELDNVLDGTSHDISLLLEKAQIYLEMDEHEKSLDVLAVLIEEYQIYAAYATEMEVHRKEWNASGVVQAGRACINYFPNYVRAYEHVAKVFLDLDRTDDLQTILAEAKENNVESVILDAYCYHMDHEVPDTEVLNQKLLEFRQVYVSRLEECDMTAYEEGLPLLTELLYWYPGTYMLVERALFHRLAGHFEEAKADFEKALAENPYHPYALNGLAQTYKFMGDYEQALIYSKKAIRYKDEEMNKSIYAEQAIIYSLLGDYPAAKRGYEKYNTGSGGITGYTQAQAWSRARCGDFYMAQQGLIHSYKKYAPYYGYDEIVEIYQMGGKEEEAAKFLDMWDKQLPLDNSVKDKDEFFLKLYRRMAWQDVIFGDGSKAVEYYEKVIGYEEPTIKEAWDMCGTLSDAVFMCIITGNHKNGKELAKRLNACIQAAKEAGKPVYIRQDKQLAQTKFHADYYAAKWDADKAKALLEEGDSSPVCKYCDYCVCKELEAAWLLWLIRCGKKEEALKRLENVLERQPLDEYQRAIKHMCEIGGFDKEVLSPDEDSDLDKQGGLGGFFKGLFGKK